MKKDTIPEKIDHLNLVLVIFQFAKNIPQAKYKIRYTPKIE